MLVVTIGIAGKNAISKDALIGAVYSSIQQEIGHNLKSRKTILIVDNPPVAPLVVEQQQPAKQTQSNPSFTVRTPVENRQS